MGRAAPGPRERLLHAAELLVDEHGEQHLTVESVCAAAGTSESVFHAVFADRTDCLLAVFDEAAERAGASMLAAYRSQERWVDGVRASLLELLKQLDSHPQLARLMIVGSAAGEPPMLVRRTRVLGELARALEAARPALAADASAAPFGTEAVIGAVSAVLHGRLCEEPPSRLVDLARPIMAMIVLPYLGVQGARAELTRRPAQ